MEEIADYEEIDNLMSADVSTETELEVQEVKKEILPKIIDNFENIRIREERKLWQKRA